MLETPIYSQNKPLTLGQVSTSLNVSNDKKKESAITAKKVRQVGVTFPLTPEIELELRRAGATNELIEAIRQNSPRLPTPTQSPIVKSNSTVSGKEMKNSIGMEFVKIPSGEFMMGSSDAEIDEALYECKKIPNKCEREWVTRESPKHKVTIKEDFWIGKFEVTQGQWQAIMDDNPSYFKDCGANCPVETVSWDDIQVFLKRLNSRDTQFEYRLPTEAEWEYAARAGTTTAFAFGDSLSSEQANFNSNYSYGNGAKGKYLEKTVSVGSYQPNAWGLYDMHGNVSEWCEDRYGAYSSSAQIDPTGATSGSYRVNRGGSWNYGAVALRSAYRSDNAPSFRINFFGFRLLRSAE